MNGDCIERLPQASQCQDAGKDGILESASNFAYRVLKEIEALAGTTSCKSVQLLKLKKWAQEQGCWFTDRSQFGDFFDRGSENEVYLSPDGTEITKLTWTATLFTVVYRPTTPNPSTLNRKQWQEIDLLLMFTWKTIG